MPPDTKRTFFSVGLAMLLLTSLFLGLKNKSTTSIHDKVVFFKTNQQLLIVQNNSVFTQNVGSKNPSELVYKSNEESTIALRYLSHNLSPNRNFLFIFEQNKRNKNVDLVIINLTANKKIRYSFVSLPKNFNYIDNDSIFLYWANGKALYINLKTNNIINEHVEPLSSVVALALHHTISLKTNKIKKDYRSYIFTPDRQHLANYHKNGLVIKLDGTQSITFDPPLLQKFLPLQVFSPNNTMIATVIGSRLSIKNIDTGEILWQKKFHSGSFGPLSLHYSPDGSKILVGGALDGQIGAIFIYNSSSGQLISRQLGLND